MRPDWKRLTVTERLRVLRKAQGTISQQQMAVEIGLDPTTDTYGHAERSGQIGGIAHRITRRFPEIDEGWLFQGLTGNVHEAMLERLSKAATDLGLVGPVRHKG